MIPTIATVTLGGDLKTKLESIANARFNSIELIDTDLDAFEGSPKELNTLIKDFGLSLASYFPLRDFEGMPKANKDTLKIIYEAAYNNTVDVFYLTFFWECK